jgi:hypothetical protein
MSIRFVIGSGTLRPGFVYKVTPLGITDLSGQHFLPNIGGDVTNEQLNVHNNEIEGKWSEAGIIEHPNIADESSRSSVASRRCVSFMTTESSEERHMLVLKVKKICEDYQEVAVRNCHRSSTVEDKTGMRVVKIVNLADEVLRLASIRPTNRFDGVHRRVFHRLRYLLASPKSALSKACARHGLRVCSNHNL